jgi:hypothetical protein
LITAFFRKSGMLMAKGRLIEKAEGRIDRQLS